MGKHKISFGLSVKEINRAIREVEKFEKEFIEKCDKLVERIAERLTEKAQQGFNGAIVDDLTELSGGPVKTDVSVRWERRGDTYVIIADGEDAVWVEFGAGVHHNKDVTHPYSSANNLGFKIGGFGQGKGNRDVWAFKDAEDDEIKFSHGTPAKMPMYNAVQAVSKEVVDLAREVFG